MRLDNRQERAVNELMESGAVEVMVSRMSLRAALQFSETEGINEDVIRDFRADMRAIRKFDIEVQAVVNEASD